MDKTEARALLEQEIAVLRQVSYSDLCTRIPAKRERFLFVDIVDALQMQTRDVIAASGTAYQLESMVMWDGKAGEAVRVVVAIDDGRRSAPMTDSFIVAPDGSFVAE
jgi:hypothetical protein